MKEQSHQSHPNDEAFVSQIHELEVKPLSRQILSDASHRYPAHNKLLLLEPVSESSGKYPRQLHRPVLLSVQAFWYPVRSVRKDLTR